MREPPRSDAHLTERERKRRDARIEELDLELPIGDGLRLADQLIQPLLGRCAIALGVDVHSVRGCPSPKPCPTHKLLISRL